MNITSKSKYALRAVIHLARAGGRPVRREDLASAQGGISTEYLEKILLRLREVGVLTAKSGPGGGYRLARPPQEITAWDVISAVEDSLAPVACLEESARAPEHPCNNDGLNCEARPFWTRVFDAVMREMKAASIAELAAERDPLGRGASEGAPQVQCR